MATTMQYSMQMPGEKMSYGPAEMYPSDPESEAHYIITRYKEILSRVPPAEFDKERGELANKADHFDVHSQVLWNDVLSKSDPLDRIRGLCRFILVFTTGLFKPDFRVAGPRQVNTPIGEYTIRRKKLANADGITLYYQEKTAYEHNLKACEQFANGKVRGSMEFCLYPTARQEGPHTTVDFGHDSCRIIVNNKHRTLPQSKDDFGGEYNDCHALSPDDEYADEDEVYDIVLPSLRISRLVQGVATCELVGISSVKCKATGLEAELRFIPQLGPGIRGRCVVDGVVRAMHPLPPVVTDDSSDTSDQSTHLQSPKITPRSVLPNATAVFQDSSGNGSSSRLSTPTKTRTPPGDMKEGKAGKGKSLWKKSKLGLSMLTGSKKAKAAQLDSRAQDSSDAVMPDEGGSQATGEQSPALLTILGHWDRKVLVCTEGSGQVAVLHDDPLIMRVDHQPVLDYPLNSALRMPTCMIHKRLWACISDALHMPTWAEPLNSVLKQRILAPRHAHVLEARGEAGAPLSYMLSYMFAETAQPKKFRVPVKIVPEDALLEDAMHVDMSGGGAADDADQAGHVGGETSASSE